MHPPRVVLLAISVVVGSTASVAPVGALPQAGAAQARNEARTTHIVVLDDDAAEGPETHAARHGREPLAVYRRALSAYATEMTASEATELQREPGVAFVSPSRAFRATASGVPTPPPCTNPPLACQTVTRGIRRIDADESSTRSGDGRGRVGANVAVLDSGVDAAHPDLDVAGGVNCFDDNVGVGADPEGHGTFVSGVIAAEDNDSFVVGVAPGARVWSVRVLDDQLIGTDASVLCGLDWVTRTRTDDDRSNDIAVVNMSLGGVGRDDGECGRRNHDPVHLAICRVTALGVSVVAAAGNASRDFTNVRPAAYREVLAVTAIADGDGAPGGLTPDPCDGAPDDAAAPFSNFTRRASELAHLVAGPGVCIASLNPLDKGGIAVGSGTSYATPFVAGTVALCITNGPCRGLAPPDVVRRVVADATAWSAANPDYGFDPNPLRRGGTRLFGPLIRAALY